MIKRWINRIIEWSASENCNPVNEDVKNEKVNRLFQRDISGTMPSPWFFV